MRSSFYVEEQIKVMSMTNGNDLLRAQAVSVSSGNAIIRSMGKGDSFAPHQHPDLIFVSPYIAKSEFRVPQRLTHAQSRLEQGGFERGYD